VNVRVIVATSRDLKQDIRRRRFRIKKLGIRRPVQNAPKNSAPLNILQNHNILRDRWASFPLPLESIRCKNTNYLNLLSAFRRHPTIVARLLVTSGQIKALSI